MTFLIVCLCPVHLSLVEVWLFIVIVGPFDRAGFTFGIQRFSYRTVSATLSLFSFFSVFFLKFQLFRFIKVLPLVCLLHLFNIIFIHELIIWDQVHIFMLLDILKWVSSILNYNKTKSLNGCSEPRVSIKIFYF